MCAHMHTRTVMLCCSENISHLLQFHQAYVYLERILNGQSDPRVLKGLTWTGPEGALRGPELQVLRYQQMFFHHQSECRGGASTSCQLSQTLQTSP